MSENNKDHSVDDNKMVNSNENKHRELVKMLSPLWGFISKNYTACKKQKTEIEQLLKKERSKKKKAVLTNDLSRADAILFILEGVAEELEDICREI